MELVRVLFYILWRSKAPNVCRKICYLHFSECGRGMPRINIRQHALRITLLKRMCLQSDVNGEFCKEYASKNLSMRNVSSCEGKSRRLNWVECSYCECVIALIFFLQASGGLFVVTALSRKVLYKVLASWTVQDCLIGELGLTKKLDCSLWLWETGLKWMVLRKVLLVGQKFFGGIEKFSKLYIRCV